MKNMFDLLIIGAGPGGYTAAKKAAKLGMAVAVIDKGEPGGTCINRGCIPTKAMLHAATLYRSIRESEKFGIHAGDVDFDLKEMIEYKDSSAAEMRRQLGNDFRELGIRFIRGRAKILAGKRVQVELPDGSTEYYFGRKLLVATGAKPRGVDAPGGDLPGVVTSEELLASSGEHCRKILVLGGGVIGVEMATALRYLGSEVTIVEISGRLLPNVDLEFSEKLERLLAERGVRICKNSRLKEITRSEDGLCCEYESPEGSRQVQVEKVLVSVGRVPDTDGLFDENVPVERDGGKILVDEFFQTSVPGIYAVGDVTGRIQLAHVAAAEGTFVVEKMNGLEPSVVVSMVPSCLFTPISIVPGCLYTDPEIASVGLTEEQAAQKGVPVRCGRYDMRGNGQKIISREAGGYIKILFARDSDVLLGAQIMCSRAADMIGELATALANGLTSRQLMYAMRAHPTFNEAISCAVENSREN